MHRIDGQGNVDGLFSEGDEQQGILATEVTADWPNAVQEELCHVIEMAGIDLNKEDNTQLLQALQGMLAAVAVPAGTVIYRAANAVPAGYLTCNGAAVSRIVYANLYAVIGTTYGVGDGVTTFNLPDLRAEFIRGWDNGRGVDANRNFGSSQDHLVKDHRHNAVPPEAAPRSYVWGGPGGGGPEDGNNSSAIYTTGDVSTAGVAGDETRPRNVAMLPCIKY